MGYECSICGTDKDGAYFQVFYNVNGETYLWMVCSECLGLGKAQFDKKKLKKFREQRRKEREKE